MSPTNASIRGVVMIRPDGCRQDLVSNSVVVYGSFLPAECDGPCDLEIVFAGDMSEEDVRRNVRAIEEFVGTEASFRVVPSGLAGSASARGGSGKRPAGPGGDRSSGDAQVGCRGHGRGKGARPVPAVDSTY